MIDDKTVILSITQSGETVDTLAAMEEGRSKGAKLWSIVNVMGSMAHRISDGSILMQAGPEIGVASTKAFTQQVLTGRIFVEALKKGKMNFEKIEKKLTVLSHRIEKLLRNPGQIDKIASAVCKHKGFIFTGRGIYYPAALEGALKLKEIAYVHAEGFAAAVDVGYDMVRYDLLTKINQTLNRVGPAFSLAPVAQGATSCP